MSLVPEKVVFPAIAMILALVGFAVYIENFSAKNFKEEKQAFVEFELERLSSNIQQTIQADAQFLRGVAYSLVTDPELNDQRIKQLSEYHTYDRSQILNLSVSSNRKSISTYTQSENTSEQFPIVDFETLLSRETQSVGMVSPGEILFSGPYKVHNGVSAFAISAPFKSHDDLSSEELFGRVHLFIDANDFFQRSGVLSENLNINVAIRKLDDATKIFGPDTLFVQKESGSVAVLPLLDWEIAAEVKPGVFRQGAFIWAVRAGYFLLGILLLATIVVISKSLSIAARVNDKAEAVEEKIRATLKQVRDRENLLRTVINEMPDVLVLKDHEGNFLLGNATVAKLYNTTPEEMVGKHDGDFGVPAEMAEFFRQNVLEIMSKGETEVVYEDSKDAVSGEIRHYKSIKKPFKGTDGQNQILVIAHDITDLVEAQNLLSESEQRLNTILDNVDAFIYLKDLQGRYLFANEAVRQLWKVGMEQLVGCGDENFFDEKTVEAIRKNDRMVLDKGQTVHAEETNTVPATGITKTYQSTKLPLRNDKGEIYALCGISVDITDLKKSEHALKESEQRFKMAGQAAYDLIYEWDVATDTLTWFGDVDSMLGFSKGKISHDIQAWLALIHPEDVAHLSDAVERHRESTQPIHYEYRIADSNGEYRFWSDRALPMIDGEGSPYKWVGVCTDITLQKSQQQKLEHNAYYDSLTGLPNRSLLTDRLKQAMSHSHRRKQQLAVVYIDLDGFKEINDTYGHEVGDKLLIAIGTRIQNHLREGDTISRLGGDEFVAVLSDLESSYAAVPLLDRLLQASSQPIMHGELILQVSASLGVTYYPQSEEIAPDQLIRQADQAMYQAKLNGKNRYFFFDAENDRTLRGQQQSDKHIERALRNQEFELYYQPKVNMHSGEVVGMEALLRWNHPEKGLLLPGEFLTGMENQHLTIQIGDWVIRSALEQIQSWLSQESVLPISVNLAGCQLQNDFIQHLKAVLTEFPDIQPEWLQLEVLESSALQDISLVSQVMRGCEKIGVSFALDDFGTGYSSLSYLKYLPAKVLKIDRSFVRDMLDDPDDMAILEGIMGMSSAFRRSVVAEGVERVEQGVFLLRLGCSLAQGFAIAKPMPASKVLEWISGWEPPEQWKRQVRVRREDLAILFAEVEHQSWVNALDHYIKDCRLIPPPLSPHDCRFGQWWDEHGQYRYDDEVSGRITYLHDRVHFCGLEIQKAMDSEDMQQVSSLQEELHRVSRELINELDRILDNLYSSQI